MAQWLIIRAKVDISGPRFSTKKGHLKTFRYGCAASKTIHPNGEKALAEQPIEWGGATVAPDQYEIVFNGNGPIPEEFRYKLPAHS